MYHQIRFSFVFFAAHFIIVVVNAAPSQNFWNAIGREFPYLVSIRKNGSYNCGGAIIDEWNILTAAHCVDRSINSNLINQLTVVSGTDNIYQGGMIHKVCRGTFYPGYERDRVGSKPNDIAVITLCEPMTFNPNQNKVSLPTRDFVDNTTAIIAGWGFENGDEKKLSYNLQKFTPKIIHSNLCKPYADYELNKAQLCAIHDLQQGPCRGISGSPLVLNNQVIGIVSWGPPRCSTLDPEIYTNVLEYLDFINLVRGNYILN